MLAGLPMSAAATAAGYLYASGRIVKLKEKRALERLHGPSVAKALLERRQVEVRYKRRRAP